MTDTAGRTNMAAITDTDTRELVLGILLEVTKNGKYSHLVMADVLDKYQYLDKRSRAFITRVTEGTLENLILIDHVLGQFSKVPVKKMKPVIRCILESAAYQILFLDGIPDAAACNEAVRLAKKKGFKNLSGFVNGVLRNLIRSRDKIQWPDREEEPEVYFSVRYSIPEWMIRMWKEDFSYRWEAEGDLRQMEAMLQAFLTPAPLTIRTNTVQCPPRELKERLEAEGVRVSPVRELPYAFQITGYDHLGGLQSFREGLFYVQDISSMLAAEAAGPKDGDLVVDVCAAPGGKALHMAQKMHGTGRVLARDLTEEKAALLRENRERCRTGNMEVQVWDALVPDESLTGKADIVMADLPCSGLGVLRKKKDIRYKMTPEQMQGLAQLQREILSVVHRYVKPGGRLVYCTCTIHKAENEDNAAWFAARYPEFSLKEAKQILPGAESGDGFFYAVFERDKSK